MPRLSLVWFPSFFWLEDLSVFGTIKLWKESAKEVALLFSTFRGVSLQWSTACLLILLPRPPSRCQIQQCHNTMSFPLKSLPNSDDWWCLFSVSKINSVVNLSGLKHSYNACGPGLTLMGTAGVCRITHSVYRCKEEKMMSSELWALQSQPWWTQNHQVVWFGTVWGSGCLCCQKPGICGRWASISDLAGPFLFCTE